MRACPIVLASVVTALAGCAASGPHTGHVAPAPASPRGAEGEAVGGGEASGPEHEPEVVRSGRAFKLSWSDAQARWQKGGRCGGDDSPEAVLGKPDQHNEMQMGRDKVVTYGFRFTQGTLMVRCRADHVEVARTLK